MFDYTTYHDTKIKPPPQDIAKLAAKLYGKLQKFVQNINNIEKIKKILLLLKLHLKC